ncbi:hypothetical protein ACLDYB_06905 [Acinetobacter baumannii]
MSKLFYLLPITLILSYINFASAKIFSSFQNNGVINISGSIIESTCNLQNIELNCDDSLKNTNNPPKNKNQVIENYEFLSKNHQKNTDLFIDEVNKIIKSTPALSINKINDQAVIMTITYD